MRKDDHRIGIGIVSGSSLIVFKDRIGSGKFKLFKNRDRDRNRRSRFRIVISNKIMNRMMTNSFSNIFKY
jgi:hypothetical protein